MKRFGMTALAAMAALTTVQAAQAQLPGIPYQPVNTGLGLNIAGDYGKSNVSGSGSALGLTAGIGVSNLGLQASVGTITPVSGGSSNTTFAGAAGLKLFGGGLTPVEIGAQLGASHQSVSGTSTNTIEPAAWVKVSPPLFPLKPWGQVYYVAGSCGTGCTFPTDTRVTVGANFNLLLGLGVHAGYDFGTKSGDANYWGIGAHINIRVPSLGVPGVPGM